MEFNPMINNSITNYNKVFNKEMQNFNIGADQNQIGGAGAFESVLKDQMQNPHQSFGPIINSGVQMNVGLENMGISPIDKLDGAAETQRRGNLSPVEKTASDFSKAFGDGLNSVNKTQNEAYTAAETFASGGDISVHEVMAASQKANLTMQMAIQLRNKMINAYTEINNVRV